MPPDIGGWRTCPFRASRSFVHTRTLWERRPTMPSRTARFVSTASATILLLPFAVAQACCITTIANSANGCASYVTRPPWAFSRPLCNCLQLPKFLGPSIFRITSRRKLRSYGEARLELLPPHKKSPVSLQTEYLALPPRVSAPADLWRAIRTVHSNSLPREKEI